MDKKNVFLKFKIFSDYNLYREEKRRENTNETSEIYYNDNDLLDGFNYSEKERKELKKWRFSIDSSKMRMYNNKGDKFLNHYRVQEYLKEDVRKETLEQPALID